ncbi:MAG: 2-oxoglutarate dehydrogenase complex dihydrolipoyllysine-residue succinyltransferase [Proteobacteria bacterium]|nr:2-oxoglutarate dehydrogenase complex dihydrolipoyllysine-residue succinyltransferase [Pseudomonadota bacterium]
MTSIVVPSLGESVSEATVAKWLKKEGEAVKADEPLVELETDKVTVEVNAPSAGVLSLITVKAGSAVKPGSVLGEIGVGAPANQSSKPVEAAKPAPAPAPTPVATTAPAASDVQSGPAARKMMADSSVSASSLEGTGKDGRITKGDVIAHLEAPAPAAKPAAPSAPAAPHVPRDLKAREERVKMSRLRQVIARRLKEAQNTAAMLTTFNEIDMTNILALREQYKEKFEKRYGVKLGFMGFFVKAAIQGLREFPAVNAEIDGEDVIYKNFYDIGVAVSTPQGLVVPVVRDADGKNLAGIEKDIGDYAKKARDGQLAPADMMGGTFTITNGGVFGSLMSTPILNTPQVGILGMHKTQQRPVVMPDGSIQARPMMYVALSYDHRIIDGREAVSFLVRVKEAIEDPARLVLEI